MIEQLLNARRGLDKSSYIHKLYIRSFGVKIAICSNHSTNLQIIRDRLPSFLGNSFQFIAPDVDIEHTFYYRRGIDSSDSLFINEDEVIVNLEPGKVLAQLSTRVRLAIAEFASDFVFVHA